MRVAGSVRDFPTNAAIGGATVVIGNVTAMTDASGSYSLTVLPGAQHVTIDGESIADVTMTDRTYRGDFYAHVMDCVGRYGTVVDKGTRQPVAGATLSLGGGSSTVTDQTGWFQWNFGCGNRCLGFNTYFLTITHPSYRDAVVESGRGICFVVRGDFELEPR